MWEREIQEMLLFVHTEDTIEILFQFKGVARSQKHNVRPIDWLPLKCIF